MTSIWADGANDRDWNSIPPDEEPELCRHGKPFTCEACYNDAQAWARQAAESYRMRELATPDSDLVEETLA